MPPNRVKAKTKLRRRLHRLVPINAGMDHAAVHQRRTAASNLLEALLSLYGLCKLSAKDLCILTYYAALAFASSDVDFDMYAYPPGKPGARYQEHLDKVLPGPGPLYTVDVPMWDRGGSRVVKQTLVSYLPERLRAEVDGDSGLRSALDSGPGDVPSEMQPACYTEHTMVQEARALGKRLPLPLAVYLDGVAFTSVMAGRSDTVLGIWVICLATFKRHLFAAVRSLDHCRCGCRGWCTLFPLFACLAWQLLAMQSGLPPPMMFNGSPWPDSHPFVLLGAYAYSTVVTKIKGDWSELTKSLGLMDWSSWCNACFLCHGVKEEMHTLYDAVSLEDLPWAPRTAADFFSACAKCEIKVVIQSVRAKTNLVKSLIFCELGGRIVSKSVAGFPLLAVGDRLEPSEHLHDIGALEGVAVGTTVIFWRRTMVGDTCVDPVRHRCPLFDRDLHTSPHDTISVDSLHTLYYGPYMRWTAAALWRLIKANPWGLVARDVVSRKALACKRVTVDLNFWYEENAIPHDRRVSDITPKMLHGGTTGAHFVAGCPMHCKAAEVAILMPFVVNLLQRHPGVLEHGAALIEAGSVLCQFNELVHSSGAVISTLQQQTLMNLMQRHMVLCGVLKIHYVPKHHLAIHLVARRAYLVLNGYFFLFLKLFSHICVCCSSVLLFSPQANQNKRVKTPEQTTPKKGALEDSLVWEPSAV